MTNTMDNEAAIEQYYRDLPVPLPLSVSSKAAIKCHDSSVLFSHSRKYEETKDIQQLRDMITEVECKELQERFQIAIDRIISQWSERHDALLDALNKLEQTRQSLKHQLNDQSQSYERCLRQYQKLKNRYEVSMTKQQQKQHLHQASQSSLFSNVSNSSNSIESRRTKSILLSSNISCLSGKSGYSASFSSSGRSSYASSVRTFTGSLAEYCVEPIATILNRANTMIDENSVDLSQLDTADINSLLSETEELNNALSSPYSFKPLLSSREALNTPNIMNVSIEDSTNNEYHSEKKRASLLQQSVSVNEQQLPQPPQQQTRQAVEPPHARRPEPSDDDLYFGCCDGFWQSFAHDRNDKKIISDMVCAYLRRGGDPNVAKITDTELDIKKGYSLLHAVIAVKDMVGLEAVIDAGAKGNVYPRTSKKEDIIAPVVLAAKIAYRAAIRLLIRRTSANLMLDRGPFGETALHAAVQSGSEDTVRCVLKLCNNKLVDFSDINGATALHYATIIGNVSIVDILVKEGHCNIDATDSKGESAVHYAVRNIKPKVMRKLVGECKANPNQYIPKKTKTPLDLAKMGDLVNITAYLKSQGAKTTKELEKAKRLIALEDTKEPQSSGMKHFLQTKTSLILRGAF